MEQSDSRKAHGHPIFVTGLDHIVVTHGTTRLCHILHATPMGALNVVSEGEESIGAKCHITHPV